MTDARRAVALATLVAVAGLGLLAPAASAAPETVGISQGGTCHTVTPYGDGTTSVVDFYDYRNTSGTEYSSYGTTDLQRTNTSQLLVYNGSEGVSLVVLHGRLNDGAGDGGHVTFDVSGLPSDGDWVVEDDQYSGRDDNFDHSGSDSHIDWFFAPNRTDGAAFRGLGGDFGSITIEPGFNQNAHHWDSSEPWSTGGTADFMLRTAPGETTGLSMTDPVTIESACAGGAPNASLSAPSEAAVGANVTLDASGSSDDNGVVEYRWDVDGDGADDATTTDPTLSHAYERTGNYTATVTVVDDAGQTDEATATVSVTDSTAPTVRIDAPDAAQTGRSVTFDGSNSTDNGQIASYRWDFGDGTTATGATVSHAYDSNGTYTVTLNVTDRSGNSRTGTTEITVSSEDVTSPVARLSVPGEAEVGRSVTLDATNSSDDGGIAEYRFDVGADGSVEASGATSTYDHAFNRTGNATVRLTVVDGAGNRNATTRTLDVVDTADPTARLAGPESARAGESVTFSAANSTDNGQVASYEWNFGDGTNATGATVSHTYDSNGTYSLRLVVVDGAGNTDSEVLAVQVTDGGTAVSIDGPSTVTAGETATFTASASGGDVESYEWDLGDGATATGRQVSHAYDEAGEVTVSVTAAGADGNSTTATKQVTVQADTSGGGGGGGGGGFAGGGGGGASDPTATPTPTPAPSSNVTVVRTSTDAVELRAADVAAGEPIAAGLPGDLGRGTVRFERVAVGHDGRVEQLRLELAAAGENRTIGDADAAPAALVRRSGSGLGSATGMDVAFSVPAWALGDDSSVSVYAREDGRWTRVPTERLGRADGRVRFRGAAGDVTTVAVGVRGPFATVDSVELPEQLSTGADGTARVTYRNPGSAALTVPTVVRADGRRLAETRTRLPAGATRTVSLNLSFDETGTRTVRVAGVERRVDVQPPAANVTVRNVTATESVRAGEPVRIVAHVSNHGTAPASYTARLELFGEVIDRKTVAVGPDERRTVEFTRRVSAPGNYTARVGNASERFSVRGETPATDTPRPTHGGGPGFGPLAAAAALGAAFLLARRR